MDGLSFILWLYWAEVMCLLDSDNPCFVFQVHFFLKLFLCNLFRSLSSWKLYALKGKFSRTAPAATVRIAYGIDENYPLHQESDLLCGTIFAKDLLSKTFQWSSICIAIQSHKTTSELLVHIITLGTEMGRFFGNNKKNYRGERRFFRNQRNVK